MCHKCRKVLQNAGRLYKHVLVHSKAEFPCGSCEKVFRYSHQLSRHGLSVHRGEPGLRCKFEQCSTARHRLADIR